MGIDPDLHRCPIGMIWGLEGDRFSVKLAEVSKEKKDRKAMQSMCGMISGLVHLQLSVNSDINTYVVAVEGQEFLIKGNAPFTDIGMLSAVTGAALGAAESHGATVYCPKPVEWKGNLPKHIHHARIARDLDFEVEIRGSGKNAYGVPKDPKIRSLLPLIADWKHGMDALGLAAWARSEHKKKWGI